MKTGYSISPVLAANAPVLDPVSRVHPDKLLHVVEAARSSLAVPGIPALDLVVVDDPAVLAELGERSAPLLIVAVYDPTSRAGVSEQTMQLGFGCVVQNLSHAAHAVGLGLQLAPDPIPALMEALAIPAAREIAFVARLGRPAHTSTPRISRDLRDLIRWNRYS